MNESEQNEILLGEEAFVDSQVLMILNQKVLDRKDIQRVNELDEYEQAMAV
jgi:hypothetical protein